MNYKRREVLKKAQQRKPLRYKSGQTELYPSHRPVSPFSVGQHDVTQSQIGPKKDDGGTYLPVAGLGSIDARDGRDLYNSNIVQRSCTSESRLRRCCHLQSAGGPGVSHTPIGARLNHDLEQLQAKDRIWRITTRSSHEPTLLVWVCR